MRDASLDEFLTDADEADDEREAHETDADGRKAGDGPESERPAPEPGPDEEIESESESESEPDADTGTDDAGESEGGPPPRTGVEPARSTYAWSPEGAMCAACGERVEERWEGEGGLVCVSCKEW